MQCLPIIPVSSGYDRMQNHDNLASSQAWAWRVRTFNTENSGGGRPVQFAFCRGTEGTTELTMGVRGLEYVKTIWEPSFMYRWPFTCELRLAHGLSRSSGTESQVLHQPPDCASTSIFSCDSTQRATKHCGTLPQKLLAVAGDPRTACCSNG